MLWVLGVLLAGTVIVALFPRFMAGAAEILPERPLLSALFGLGWAILIPIAAVIAAITFVGLPLAMLAIPVYMIGLAIATIPFAVWLGRLLLGARARPGRSGAVVSYLVGALLLIIVGLDTGGRRVRHDHRCLPRARCPVAPGAGRARAATSIAAR